MTSMVALVVGCGSIGRKHIANLAASESIRKVLVHTKNGGCLEGLDDGGKAETAISLDEVSADFAVIANETYLHMETAIKLARRGIHLLIEKPLSHSLDGVDELRDIAARKGVKILIGYNLRFLGIMSRLKALMGEGIIGRPYFARIEVGQHLSAWRKGRDYTASYSVSREKGGGVALDLSHEVDYMRYLFGEPLTWKTLQAKAGDLEMDAEDVFEGMYLFDSGFVCDVHMDCLQREATRYIRVVGSKGTILCDIIGRRMTVKSGDGELIIDDPVFFDIGATYRDEISHFMDVINNGAEPFITLEDGIRAIKMIEDR